MPLPMSVLEAVAEASAALLGEPVESVALPLALPWLDSRRALMRRTFPAAQVAELLAAAIKKQIARRVAAA